MKLLNSVAIAGLMLSCLTVVYAQDNASSLLSATSEKNTNTNYYYARPNDITIIVNVMGFVQRPGRYEIGSSIDLLNVISLAGGPTVDGSLSKVKIIRITKDGEKTVRQDIQPDQKTLSAFLKEEVKVTRQEIRLDLENLSTVRPEDLQMSPGDIVYVDRTTWSTIRDVFGVVVSTAIIVQAVAIATRR
jgi:protein involved in polysaccharide export with SLBB domain